MRNQAVLTIAALAVALGGCSSRPRNFAPVLSAAPADKHAHETHWRSCRQQVAAGTYNRSGVAGSAAGGLAAGAAGTAAVGAATAGTYATYGGAAAAMGATIIAAPIAVIAGAWGISKIKKTKKEKLLKAATAECMAAAGYKVDKWRVMSKREARALDASKAQADKPAAPAETATAGPAPVSP